MSAIESAQFGVRSMSAPLRRVAVRRPALSGDWAEANWQQVPDPSTLERQHEGFVELVSKLGATVELLDPLPDQLDACYVRDPVLLLDEGIAVLRCAKPIRRREGEFLAADLEAAGVPRAGALSEPAVADGGDLIWLDQATMAVGRGYRTNPEGIKQLRGLLSKQGTRLISYDLAHDQGPSRVLHLMSVISPIADDMAVVYPPLAPVALMEDLAERGVRVIEVPHDEYLTLGCNVLAVRPGVVVMCDGNPETRRRLEAAGCEVHTYAGSEISMKGEGGPTCLTLPLLRSP
jgi:N-dimethylarginine dimethylaminohydrolase